MHELLTNIVKRQESELRSLIERGTIQRRRVEDLNRALPSSLAKVIIGPRRAGKSTAALQALAERKFAYLNFEDESLPEIYDGDVIIKALNSVYGEVEFYLFDEIQNFPRWEQFLNRQLRLNRNMIVTGSNAHLLSEELASALTGRHVEIEILPLSFREISTKVMPNYTLEMFLAFGGFPEVVLGRGDSATYLRVLWDSIILKDIARRKKVRNIRALNDVLSLLLSSVASKFNIESLNRNIGKKVSAPTIKKFLNYGQEAYLISEISLYNVKPKLRLKSDRKIYTVDNGFYSSKNLAPSSNVGVLLENSVFNELCFRGYKPNLSLFYFQTRSGFEVDFILKKGHQITEAIQVCCQLGSLKTRDRELRSLVEVAEELQVEKLTVINLEEDQIETVGGRKIEVVPVKKWLLRG